MLARYFSITANRMKPITTLIRSIQPPLRGSFFKYDGNAARKKKGAASPAAKLIIPAGGRDPPDCTEAVRMLPKNGPTQANEVSENVSPMINVPSNPPRRDALSRLLSNPDGSAISNAPSKLIAKIVKTSAMKVFTHTFEPSCTTPNGPTAAETPRPKPVKNTMMPIAKTAA